MLLRQILCPVGVRCQIDMQYDATSRAYCRGPSQGDGQMQSEMWDRMEKDSGQKNATNNEEEDDTEEKEGGHGGDAGQHPPLWTGGKHANRAWDDCFMIEGGGGGQYWLDAYYHACSPCSPILFSYFVIVRHIGHVIFRWQQSKPSPHPPFPLQLCMPPGTCCHKYPITSAPATTRCQ
jgi:hypothetical protein